MKLIFSKKIKVELFLERVVPGEEDTGKWLFRRSRKKTEKGRGEEYETSVYRRQFS